MEVDKNTLDKIRTELPHGSQVKIAEEANYTDEYVSMVLNGSRPITDGNKIILSIAQRLIREKREEDEKILRGLENLNPTK